jgi:hypothetical protein
MFRLIAVCAAYSSTIYCTMVEVAEGSDLFARYRERLMVEWRILGSTFDASLVSAVSASASAAMNRDTHPVHSMLCFGSEAPATRSKEHAKLGKGDQTPASLVQARWQMIMELSTPSLIPAQLRKMTLSNTTAMSTTLSISGAQDDSRDTWRLITIQTIPTITPYRRSSAIVFCNSRQKIKSSYAQYKRA